MLTPRKTITFVVQGSSPEPYTVTFTKTDDRLNAFCTCPAGEKGQYCKHRFRILSGDSTGIIGDNMREVPTVRGWMHGSPLESAFQQLQEAEIKAQKAEKELSRTKKALAKVMHGHI